MERIKILFVCLGNICRSPMAEFYMKDLVRREGLADLFEIASAATSDEERGNPVYPPARRKLMEHDIDPSGKTARRMTRADYAHYDRLVCMDYSNLHNMERICGGDPDGKMSMLLDYTDRPGAVADPWYTGDFEATWRDVKEGCNGLLHDILKIKFFNSSRSDGSAEVLWKKVEEKSSDRLRTLLREYRE